MTKKGVLGGLLGGSSVLDGSGRSVAAGRFEDVGAAG